jgi:hypothetical protein
MVCRQEIHVETVANQCAGCGGLILHCSKFEKLGNGQIYGIKQASDQYSSNHAGLTAT